MPTLTYTDTADFAALAHCSIEDGAVRVGKYNFASDDTGTGLADFTQVPGSAGGSIALHSGALRITPPASLQGLINDPGSMADVPYAHLPAMAGDWKIRVHVSNLSVLARALGIVAYRVDDNDYGYAAFWASGGGDWYARSAKVVGGARTNTDTAGDYAGSDVWVEYERDGNSFYLGIADTLADLESQSGTYTALATQSNAYATSGVIALAAEYLAAQEPVDFDDLHVIAGHTAVAQCLVGDQGGGTGRYMDAGSGLSFDYSTFSPSLSNCTVTWDVKESDAASFDGASWDATGLTTAQLQARADSGKRYLQLRANLTASGASPRLDAVSLDAYSLDVTPPALPTAAIYSAFGATHYALNWSEPDDADFSHCELQRIVDGSTSYLANNGGLPEWQASPSVYWRLRDGAGGSGITPHSAFVDESVAGDAVAYRVRALDTLGNASAWQSFTFSAAGGATTAPAAPTLAIVDDGDGAGATATVSGSDAGTTNTVSVAPVGSSAWTAKATLAGDGESGFAAAPGHYWGKAVSASTGGSSVSNIVAFHVAPLPGAHELRTYLRTRLAEDGMLTGLLASVGNVYHRLPPLPMEPPLLVYELTEEPDRRLDAAGALHADLTLRLYAADAATLDALDAAADDLLSGHVFSTTHYVCRRSLRVEAETRHESGLRTTEGAPLLERRVRYRLRVFRKGA